MTDIKQKFSEEKYDLSENDNFEISFIRNPFKKRKSEKLVSIEIFKPLFHFVMYFETLRLI